MRKVKPPTRAIPSWAIEEVALLRRRRRTGDISIAYYIERMRDIRRRNTK